LCALSLDAKISPLFFLTRFFLQQYFYKEYMCGVNEALTIATMIFARLLAGRPTQNSKRREFAADIQQSLLTPSHSD
jgi:hypothetical protein